MKKKITKEVGCYKINVNELMKDIGRGGGFSEIIVGLINCVRSIFYLLEASRFGISEELYMTLDDSGKKYFIKSLKENEKETN